MLILVAVTVTVAKDGGLFTTARTAKTGTQKEADRENLVAAAVGAYDARSQEVKKEELKQNLGNEWKVENQTNYYKVTSPNGNEFKVNIKNATVEDNDGGKESQNQDEIDWNSYVNGETVPTFTLNSVIPTKDWSNWPTTNYDGKGPNEVRFQIIRNSDSYTWDYEYVEGSNGKSFNIFHGDDETYSYYWNESDSPIGKIGWVFRPTYNGTPTEADTLPVFTDCVIKLSDTVPDNEKTEYAEKLNTFLKDIFILVNE